MHNFRNTYISDTSSDTDTFNRVICVCCYIVIYRITVIETMSIKNRRNDFDYDVPSCTHVTENKSWRGNMPQWGVYHSNDAS
jgi:hypothetical protein